MGLHYLEVWQPQRREVLALEAERVTVGKAASNDIPICSDDTVSRLHAVLERFAAGWCIRDLDSHNGTWVNERRVLGEQRLHSGDEIRVGSTRLVFRVEGPSRAETATQAAEAAPVLTLRERDVLVALCQPLFGGDLFTEPASIRQIAEQLVVTEAAIKQHLLHLYGKFQYPRRDHKTPGAAGQRSHPPRRGQPGRATRTANQTRANQAMSALIRERYEVLATVGRGGQGTVKRALDTVHQRQVALKVITLSSPGERQTVSEEARILLSLRPHPNLPLLREDFTDANHCYLIIDWIEGRTLAQVLHDEGTPGLPLDRVLDYLSQAAEALDHLHDHDPPVVHQDVKPANLILTPDGRVVLVDFGISRHWPCPGPEPRGTPDYAAPETASEPPTSAADIYSLAVTAYTLLSGAPPRPETRPQLNDPSSEGIIRALRRGLAIDPTRRPPSAAAFIEALQAGTRQPNTANPTRNSQRQHVPTSAHGYKRRIRGFVGTRRVQLMLAGTLVTLVVIVVAVVQYGRTWVSLRADTPSPQVVRGPAWIRDPPIPVSPHRFGVTITSTSGNMPSFQVGAVRLWDSGTKWSNVEPRKDEFNWEILDRLVAGAERAKIPVLYVMGMTPSWANPGGAISAYPDGARKTPPLDLADWDHYVRKVAERYRDRIHAYELWDYANSSYYYTGSPEILVEMVRHAGTIINEADPKATVVCPSMGDLWEPAAREFMYRFAVLGGYRYCHVASVKLEPRTPTDKPETIIELAPVIDNTLRNSGVAPPMWVSAVAMAGWNLPNLPPLQEEDASNYAVRFFLVGLYLRNFRYERMYFYTWGSRQIPLVLQAEGGEPTQAARYFEELQRWLADASIRSCSHGVDVHLPANVWQCKFDIPNAEGKAESAVIRWTDGGSVTMKAETGAYRIKQLDRTAKDVNAGDDLHLTERPIIILFREPPH